MNLKQKWVVALGAFALAFGNGSIVHFNDYDLSTAVIVAVLSFFGGLIWFNLSANNRLEKA